MDDNRATLAGLLSWAGILVPIVLVFLTALIRSLAKGNKFFSGENLYLGIDLCFAGLAASLVEVLDVFRQHVENPNDSQLEKAFIGLILAFVCGIALLVVTKLHQEFDDNKCPNSKISGRHAAEQDQAQLNKNHRRKQIIWLGLASNGMGFATICMFAWLRARRLV